MAWFMGIDIGSMYGKGVIVRDSDIHAYYVLPSGSNYQVAAEKIREELLTKLDLSQDNIKSTVATGVGATDVHFADHNISDYICTARGINSIFPQAKSVIDVAGLSMKVIQVDDKGRVMNFLTSERCAAGSGRFISVIANVLRIDLEDFGALSLKSQNPVTFSAGCAVFAETEAITRVSEGIPKEDIAAGVNRQLADKAYSMLKRIKLEGPFAICGGGALNIGLIKSMEAKLGEPVLMPPQPQLVTAIGAAIISRQRDKTVID